MYCHSQADFADHPLTNYFNIDITFSKILGAITMKMHAVMTDNHLLSLPYFLAFSKVNQENYICETTFYAA